ncbi:carbohydrate ABC transporter permease [Humibacter sp. RRB41]|uniref:carbohydrate ABC transporter permease n=1 Tax=Humibacter sp. RRB41 TaxID=2919946 RepID=UPI001FAA7946|nr:carbohydrate ABC transporter permease [Humibacter sp. RRB41]
MSALGQTIVVPGTDSVAAEPISAHHSKRPQKEAKPRGAISTADRNRPVVKVSMWIIQIVMFIGLIFAGLGPILWSARASVAPSQTIVSNPMGIWFSPYEWGNLLQAWNGAQIGSSLANTAFVAIGSTVSTLFISATGAYLLSVLRPKWGPILSGAILATLFLPGVISLVPLYLTILHMPVIGVSLQNTFWAVWLPAGASAFNVIVLKRFFDSIPRELIEAAKIDGAGQLRVFTTVVIPLSRPILGVVTLLTVIGSWKDYLWPMLVLTNPNLQPVSVVLGSFGNGTSQPFSVQMAAVFLTIIIPVILFIIFQKQFLRGVGAAGGIKG